MRLRMSLLCLVVLVSGCGTLFAAGPDRIPVTSNPPGARVFLDGQEVGTTPMTLVLDRGKATGNIRIQASGHQAVAMQRGKEFNTVAILNCLGLLWWVVDLATGNWQRFDTTPVDVQLVPGQ